MHKVLDRRSQVAATGPDILNKSDLIWVDSESLREPAIVELNTFFLEELVVVWLVEHLDAHHDKAGVVATRDANVIQIVEASAELRADQRIGGRVKLSSHAVGLEAEDASSHIVDVVSPTSHDWVPINGGARDASRCERLFETYINKEKVKNGAFESKFEMMLK